MFGYVRAPGTLSPADKQLFQGAYCGLCRTLGKQYGWSARLILNFDLTFLAILLSPPEEPACRDCRCVAHRCRKESVIAPTPALELVAAQSVILAWWQLQDGIADSGFWKGLAYRAASLGLRRAYRKARRHQPAFDKLTQLRLAELTALEKEGCPSMDRAADTFARLLSGAAEELPDPRRQRVVGQMLYHLGRWVYLVDAADDLEKDLRQGSYNPLALRFTPVAGKLSSQDRETLALSLDQSIRQIAAAYELTDFGVWSGVIGAVVYNSLYHVGGAVLKGTFRRRRKKESKEEDV